jgi:hypothetical protein
LKLAARQVADTQVVLVLLGSSQVFRQRGAENTEQAQNKLVDAWFSVVPGSYRTRKDLPSNPSWLGQTLSDAQMFERSRDRKDFSNVSPPAAQGS